MLESVLKKKIKSTLESNGWMVITLLQTSHNGIPDLLCLRNKRAVFIEVKQKGKKPRELQVYRISKLNAQGFEVIVADDMDTIKPLCELNSFSKSEAT